MSCILPCVLYHAGGSETEEDTPSRPARGASRAQAAPRPADGGVLQPPLPSMHLDKDGLPAGELIRLLMGLQTHGPQRAHKQV